MREHTPQVRLRELCHTSRQPQKRVFMVAVLRKPESLDVGPHCAIVATNMLKLLLHLPIRLLLLLLLVLQLPLIETRSEVCVCASVLLEGCRNKCMKDVL